MYESFHALGETISLVTFKYSIDTHVRPWFAEYRLVIVEESG